MDDEMDSEEMIEVIEDVIIEDESDSDAAEGSDTEVEQDVKEEDPKKPDRDDARVVFGKHKGSVFCCQLEPSTGAWAVTGGEDDLGYVWETHTGSLILQCDGHKDSVNCVGFSYDGSYVATGDMSGIVKVWKMVTKTMVWETNIGDLEWIKWHHGANVLLGGAISGEVYMWRIPGGECKILPGNGTKTECGVIMPDGKRAAVGYLDGSVKIFDMKAATVLHQIEAGQAHSDSLTGIDAHPDNNLIITGGIDGRAVILKTQTGKILSKFDCKDNDAALESSAASVEAVGFSRDVTFPLAATGSLDGLLCIWDVSRGVIRHKLKQGSGITKLLWDKSNPLLYTARLDGNIELYDARSGSLERQFQGHTEGILDISLSTDSETLLSSSYDHTARVYSVHGVDR